MKRIIHLFLTDQVYLIILLAGITLLPGCKEDEELIFTIEILKPAKGEMFKASEPVIIQWKTNGTGNFNIDLYRDGEFHSVIATNISGVFYQWSPIGTPAGDGYSAKVSSVDQPQSYAESNEFELLPILPAGLNELVEEDLAVNGHSLRLYTAGSGDVTLLFEHGGWEPNFVGADTWLSNRLLNAMADDHQVIAYNRSGWPPSTMNEEVKSLVNMTSDVDQILEQKAGDNKIILVGFSYGGMITRYYSVIYKDKVDALLFIDPNHEAGADTSQDYEDGLLNQWNQNPGPIGEKYEILQWVENWDLIKNLDDLPDIPVVVLSSTEITGFYEAHKELGAGVTDFTHRLVQSGHGIHREDPEIVYKYLLELLEKI